jgi:hypothetical protein
MMTILQNKRTRFMLIGATCSILLGLPYILHFFGPTEAEVAQWGLVCSGMGFFLGVFSIAFGSNNDAIAKILLSLGFVGVALLQFLPIYLWFQFHGTGISDGSPPSAFVAHWVYALPHLALLIVSIMAIYHKILGISHIAWFSSFGRRFSQIKFKNLRLSALICVQNSPCQLGSTSSGKYSKS